MFLPKSKVDSQKLRVKSLKKGFSLIELLVVVAITGILASFISASLVDAQKKARDGRRKSDLKTIQQALELYFQQNSHYPALADWSFKRPACPTVPWSWNNCESAVNVDLRAALLPFITNIPVDPINYDAVNATNLGYLYEGQNFSYTIYVRLENTNDPDINCPGGCGWSNYANFRVQNP